MGVMNYGPGSVYKQTGQANWFLDNLNLPNLQSDPTDKALVVATQYDFKPYLLSDDLYGNQNYWWVFQVLNMGVIRDPIYDFRSGITIRVPTRDRLLGLGVSS